MKLRWHSARCVMFTSVICLPLVTPVRAYDYESVHRVEPGEIISADMINELFEQVESVSRAATADDFLGTWKGTFYTEWTVANGWATDSVSGCRFLTNATVLFTNTGPGSYEIRTSAPNPFQASYGEAYIHGYRVEGGGLLIDWYGVYSVRKLGENRISLERTARGTTERCAFLAVLDRQGVPPRKPKLTSASVLGRDVILTWQDNSDDEDSFVVWRKDNLSGSYSNVCTTGGNVVCFTNTVPASGIYWYRIAATNSFGICVGSNVKRVVVP